MIGIQFNQAFAETVVEALRTGGAIKPPSGTWTGHEMLALAGMLYAGVMSQGPHAHQIAGVTEEMRRQMPFEHLEATQETFTQDIHDAIEFISTMTFLVIDGEYAKHCGPDVRAVLYRDGDIKKVVAVEGIKNTG